MVAIAVPVSANSVKRTAIVVGKTSAVNTVNVQLSVVQNVIQILVVVRKSIAVNDNSAAMFVDEIALGKHACQVLTAEVTMNIVQRIKFVRITGTVSIPVTAKMMENVAYMVNVLPPAAQRNVFQMSTVYRRHIAVNADTSTIRMFVYEVASGKHVIQVWTAVVLTNPVTRQKYVKNLDLMLLLRLDGLFQ